MIYIFHSQILAYCLLKWLPRGTQLPAPISLDQVECLLSNTHYSICDLLLNMYTWLNSASNQCYPVQYSKYQPLFEVQLTKVTLELAHQHTLTCLMNITSS